jgi:DNA-binding LacI/PurR family transcriptional regulator
VSTISDVARAAGVSVATVSRALRGLDRVSPETRDRVAQAARELNYVASPTATSLASGRTRIVGVAAPFLTRWFFATLLSSIEKALRAEGHHVLLLDLEDGSNEGRMPLSRSMLWKRVDGLIALNIPFTDQERALLDRMGLPVVTVGNRLPGWPSVRIDDVQATRTAVQHLMDLGHTELGYVGAVPRALAHLQTPKERLLTFQEVLAEHGLRARSEWLLKSDWTAEGASRDADELFTSGNLPTGLVAGSDEMAIGVLSAAQRHGVLIPQDVSLVGIDDFALSAVLGLTTVRQDVAVQGGAAGATLLRLLAGDAVEPEADIIVPTELVVRSTTARPRQAQPHRARPR